MLRQFAYPAAAIATSALSVAVWWPAWWGFILVASALALSVWWACVVPLRIPEQGSNYLAVWRGSLFRLVRCSLFGHGWSAEVRLVQGTETIVCRQCGSNVTSWTTESIGIRYDEQE